ncbi:DinB family protein [Enterovibrio nigricans]|uniref:Uncharacterized damage-inducible protein DinB (Forms a four-helix bundle) n=1 Tax=Enterovibrio nigricans DSM 22720 TaxID=1121868 RepID=A0A1T4UQ69_9GAMM|nr:DinB family protein [Enterovibrio nigricans]PKF51059.1 damage-inducible protein DinB [Enterovibrio nigricans]SKA54849.1 Uncharacterized damage-inducible protein DinB (forms a four-helix bundle) [Enterovibrio nigricans DSM 22720]
MKSQFVLLARYNQWMNDALYEKAKSMTKDNLYTDKGAFFGSAFHTLSHIFTGDLLWLNRLTTVKGSVDLSSELASFPMVSSNKVHIYHCVEELSHARTRLDALIMRWVDGIDVNEYENTVQYKNLAGLVISDPLSSVLLHFFNHQTHHRGQFTTLLSQSGDSEYVTDLIALLRQ